MIGDVLWTPPGGPAPEHRGRPVHDLAGRPPRPRLPHPTTSCSAGRSTTWRGSGARCGSSTGSAPTRPYERVLASAADAGGASGSPARDSTTPSTWSGSTRIATAPRCVAQSQTRPAVRAHVRRAARSGGARRGPACSGSASGPATGSSPTCPTSPRRWPRSSPRPAWARSGPPARPSSAPAA